MATTIKGWLKIPENPTEFVLVGRLYAITQHYVPQLRSSAACLSPQSCSLCESLMPIQQIAVIPLMLEGKQDIWLLRLLPSQQSLIQTLANKGNSLIGSVVQIEKAPGKELSRAMLAITGKKLINPPPVENYIRAIGRRAYELAAERILRQPELPQT